MNKSGSVVTQPAPSTGLMSLNSSWRRCQERYHLDPHATPQLSSLSDREVSELCEPFDATLETITAEMEFVQSTLGGSKFCASFSNMAGIILRYRGDPQNDEKLKLEQPGMVWAEGAAGTNAVGTCIIERRPLVVLGEHHYFRAYTSISCTAAPVMSADGDMIGVLNAATGDPSVTSGTFTLASSLITNTAERLSNQLFFNNFLGNSILKIRGNGPAILLAFDGDQRIVGANRQARDVFGSLEAGLNRTTLWELFHSTPEVRDGISSHGRVLGLRGIESEVLCEAEVIVAKSTTGRRSVQNSTTTIAASAIEPLKHRAAAGAPSIDQCLGSHPRLTVLSRLLRRVSGSGLPILLLGETGVGKDTLANALHREGDRSQKPLVAFNCAAVPETLIDSELFGYGSGAFTGAKREGNIGRLKQADGGTLFLDEIGDMPLSLQTRLLRVLETGEVSPLGSAKTQTVDINIIAATNSDLSNAVSEGRFRRDLYYRLAGVVVDMQPLRERTDILDIARRLLDDDRGGPRAELSSEAEAAFETYAWPGNIREMRYVLQRARRVCENGVIEIDDLMLADPTPTATMRPQPSAAPAHPRQTLHDAERQMIVEALGRLDSDVSRTAEALDMSRATLYRKMRAHGIVAQKVVRG
jgi:transcriptional regulator of acetoin/glycerol metabolism